MERMPVSGNSSGLKRVLQGGDGEPAAKQPKLTTGGVSFTFKKVKKEPPKIVSASPLAITRSPPRAMEERAARKSTAASRSIERIKAEKKRRVLLSTPVETPKASSGKIAVLSPPDPKEVFAAKHIFTSNNRNYFDELTAKDLSKEENRKAIVLFWDGFCFEGKINVDFSAFSNLAQVAFKMSELHKYPDTEGLVLSVLNECLIQFDKLVEVSANPRLLSIFANGIDILGGAEPVERVRNRLGDIVLKRDLSETGPQREWKPRTLSNMANVLGKVRDKYSGSAAKALDAIGKEVERRGKNGELIDWIPESLSLVANALGKTNLRRSEAQKKEAKGDYFSHVDGGLLQIATAILHLYQRGKLKKSHGWKIDNFNMIGNGLKHPSLRVIKGDIHKGLLAMALSLRHYKLDKDASQKHLVGLAGAFSRCYFYSAERAVESLVSEYFDRIDQPKFAWPSLLSILNSLSQLTLSGRQIQWVVRLFKFCRDRSKTIDPDVKCRMLWCLTLCHFMSRSRDGKDELYKLYRTCCEIPEKSCQESEKSPQEILKPWQKKYLKRYWSKTGDPPTILVPALRDSDYSVSQMLVYEKLRKELPRSCEMAMEVQIDNYPVDIFLSNEKVCIEVDGPHHFLFQDPEDIGGRLPPRGNINPVRYDRRIGFRAKSQFIHAMLEKMGFRVFRVFSDDVLMSTRRLQEFVNDVRRRIGHHQQRSKSHRH